MDYQKAAAYWQEQSTQAKQMDSPALLAEIEKFIAAHNTCALATGCGEFVRCTPIEYNYNNGKFWLLSEGGLKFRALEGNKNVCLAIYDNYTGFGSVGGMQVSGRAEMVEPWSDDYYALLAYKKIPSESLQKLSHPLYLIKITPTHIDFLSSELKKRGYDSRQQLEF